jgi:formyltetrahydrofolate deformylase
MDRIGIVADISRVLAANGLNIVVMREFVDVENNQFFARIECVMDEEMSPLVIEDKLRQKMPGNAAVRVSTFPSDKRLVVLVTKEHHCLADILVKNFFGQLSAKVCCVVGNRESLSSFTQRFSIPFFHISHVERSKEQFERELADRISSFNPDYIVLAKFMQILSEGFVVKFPNRIINIHHSFLPAFIGANPYKQAYARGVKIIGATAHFVTADLDNGPIISQETMHVNHNYNAYQMRVSGQEIERNVLNKALSLVLNDRVFAVGNKTVIFE